MNHTVGLWVSEFCEMASRLSWISGTLVTLASMWVQIQTQDLPYTEQKC